MNRIVLFRASSKVLIIVALLTLVSSTFSQTPKKGPTLASGTIVISDEVVRTGNKISGGWREYAIDWSWRRVVFTLDGQTGTVVFGDGKTGKRLPGVTHFAWTTPGPKASQSKYDEARTFGDINPSLLDKANQGSPIPSDVARRVREIGGDIRLLGRLMDISNRMTDVGSAFDAMRRPGDDGGLTGGFPGSSTRGKDGKWQDPRGGVGRDGRASDSPGGKLTAPDETISKSETTDSYGTRTIVVVRHSDRSTTTRETYSGRDGSSHIIRTEKDKNGQETSGSSSSYQADTGASREESHHYDARDNMVHWSAVVYPRTGNARFSSGIRPPSAPSEVPFSGRGGNEKEMARYVPWFMDIQYIQWKRESELVKSGGRISQPGGQPTLVLNEGPEVGVSGVVNCGDATTMPCARHAGVGGDVTGRLRNLSQPGRGVPTGPLDGKPSPRPIPTPRP